MGLSLEGIAKGIASFIGGTALAISLAGCPQGSPDVKPDYTAEKQAITKAADRLVATQNNDGGWEWSSDINQGPVIDTNSATGIPSPFNTLGVTAKGLLDAYKITGDSKYLEAAKKTGVALVAGYHPDGSNAYVYTGTGNRINSSNVKFLYELAKASGNSDYTSLANILMNNVITHYPTGISLIQADEARRGTGNGNGIVPWDVYPYAEDAVSAGNSGWASDLEDAIKNDSPLDISSTTDATYILGLSAMTYAGNDAAKQKLIAAQKSDGTWTDSNGTVQNTAYAVMALVKAGDMAQAYSGAKAGVNNQMVNGGWMDSDGFEYTEADSEVIQAISDYISSN